MENDSELDQLDFFKNPPPKEKPEIEWKKICEPDNPKDRNLKFDFYPNEFRSK